VAIEYEQVDHTIREMGSAASGAVCVGLAGCREVLLRVARDGRVGGGVTPVISALTNLCLDDPMAGRWAEAQRLADEGLELVNTTCYRLVAWVFQHRKAVLAAARGAGSSGHLDQGRPHLNR
jgi:hypothetical protein